MYILFFRLLSLITLAVFSFVLDRRLTERTAAQSSTPLETMMNPIMPEDISMKGIPRQQWASLFEVFKFRKVSFIMMFWSRLEGGITKTTCKHHAETEVCEPLALRPLQLSLLFEARTRREQRA